MSQLFRNKYRIESIRLQNHDYRFGLYFVTICTRDKMPYFGKIKNGVMHLSKVGKIAEKEWLRGKSVRNNVYLDEFVIMPDHFHGIVGLNVDVETRRSASLHRGNAPLQTHCGASVRGYARANARINAESDLRANIEINRFGSQSDNLASLIRGFKASVTRECNKNNIPFRWKERFYESIIKSDHGLEKVREYIINNPKNWKGHE